MKNKFNLTLEENIFIAKRNVVDYIYKSARLEGFAVTFSQTAALYEGANIASLSVNEVVAINNLKHAWQFLLETMDYPKVDFAYICEINKIVGANLFNRAGFIRNVPVSIGGTSWKPQIPFQADIIENINSIFDSKDGTERAIILMLYLMRTQMFLDGNKRTAMLCANRIMIENGAGVISIPIEKIDSFKEHLIKYYESDEMQDIARFIYEECIDGIELKELSQDEIRGQEERSARFKSYKNKFFEVEK